MAAPGVLPTPAPPPIDSKHMATTTTTTTRAMGRGEECPECGTSLDGSVKEVKNAQQKIEELEAQVQMLTMKATAAADKCADYEDQLRAIRASNSLPRNTTTDTLTPHEPPSFEEPRPSTANSISAKTSRFSFLRRGSPAQPLPSFPPPTPTTTTPETTHLLEQQLLQERALRAKAEERARKVDGEIEELSVQLFSEANEMVAEERRARKRLEERVEMLEKKDRDKMARLERLEKAVMRIDRVKALLGKEGNGGGLAVPGPGAGRKS